MKWGYALVWPHQFDAKDPDPILAKLKALHEYGLTWMHASPGELEAMEPARRDRIFGFVAEHDLGFVPVIHANFFADDPTVPQRQLEEEMRLLDQFLASMRAPIVTTSVGAYHRFLAEPQLEFQLDRLAMLLAEPAKRLRDQGTPLGIENHGDYYCSDLVELCDRTPGLGIFLDTGNTYLVGEQPLPAFEAAAPYVVGTHFKDHVVGPNPDILHFEIGPSTLGEGHVPLRECYEILVDKHADPESIAMMIELIPPSFAGNDNVESFEKSVAFVKSLGGSR